MIFERRVVQQLLTGVFLRGCGSLAKARAAARKERVLPHSPPPHARFDSECKRWNLEQVVLDLFSHFTFEKIRWSLSAHVRVFVDSIDFLKRCFHCVRRLGDCLLCHGSGEVFALDCFPFPQLFDHGHSCRSCKDNTSNDPFSRCATSNNYGYSLN